MKQWFKHPIAYIVIVVAIFCGMIFVGAAIPGFNKLPSNTSEMKLVIVDQDKSTASKAITKQLKKNLPLSVSTSNQLADAKTNLKKRKTDLILQIPADFSSKVKSQNDVALTFYQNDSNGMLQNSFNKSLISKAESKIQSQLTSQKTTQAVAKMLAPSVAKKVQAKVAAKAKAAAASVKSAAQAQAIQKQAQAEAKQVAQTQTKAQAEKVTKALSRGVTTNTVHINQMASNYQYQMAPMFLNLGTYLGIMLMSVVLTLMFMSARFTMGKVRAFTAMQLNGICGAVLVPFFTVGLLKCMISFDTTMFWNLIGGQILFGLAIFEMTNALAILLGSLPSMIIQLPLLVMQTIAGGGILSRTVMNGFYQWISTVTPMYQGVYSTFNTLFGGDSSALYSALVWMIMICFIASMVFSWIGHRKLTQGVLANVVKF